VKVDRQNDQAQNIHHMNRREVAHVRSEKALLIHAVDGAPPLKWSAPKHAF